MRRLDVTTWRLVSPLLDRALDLDSEGREGFLVQVRVERPELAALLEDLLAEYERVVREGFLETPLLRRPEYLSLMLDMFRATACAAATNLQ
jgi:hypothetical protein